MHLIVLVEAARPIMPRPYPAFMLFDSWATLLAIDRLQPIDIKNKYAINTIAEAEMRPGRETGPILR